MTNQATSLLRLRWVFEKTKDRSYIKKATAHSGAQRQAHALPLELQGRMRLADGHARGAHRHLSQPALRESVRAFHPALPAGR